MVCCGVEGLWDAIYLAAGKPGSGCKKVWPRIVANAISLQLHKEQLLHLQNP